MTEGWFWGFLEHLWRTNGREAMMAGMVDDPDPRVQATSHYIMSHTLLPRECNKLPVGTVVNMSRLLLGKGIQRKTREAIMMILAHHGSENALDALRKYNMRPNKGLEVFAEMALEECKDWHNGTVMKVDLINR
ncbi:MAG: hypothetical protein P9L93_02975 [Candidatus Gorgyraea atricola]|nr:hypothetical protein [Candidatus Gorgyraea atricola]